MSDKDLLSILEEHFGNVKVKGEYAYIHSPFNPDDKTPSCAVTLRDGRFSEGFFKDFSSGKSGNIYSFLKIPHAFGKFGKHKKLTPLVSPVKAKFHMSRFEYGKSPYLYNRGISYEVQERFRTYESSDRVSMPVFDKDGYFLYDVSRLTKTKGFANSAATDAYPACTHAFGVTDMVFVCESMIDAYSFYTVGLKALSMNSAENYSQLPEVFKEHCGTIVLALDPDKVGVEHAAQIMKLLWKKDIVNLKLPYDVNECLTQMLSALGREVALARFRDYMLRSVSEQRGA